MKLIQAGLSRLFSNNLVNLISTQQQTAYLRSLHYVSINEKQQNIPSKTTHRKDDSCSGYQTNTDKCEQFTRLYSSSNRSNSKNNQLDLKKKLSRPEIASYKPVQTPSDLDHSKPNKDQLNQFAKYIEKEFPKFFRIKLNLSYFELDLTVEDNMSGVTKMSFGLRSLLQKIMFIRLYYSTMYSFNMMSVLSIAKLPDEGVIKVRWRITSKGRAFIFLQFWRVRDLRRIEHFNDGIVEFHLNGAGRVNLIVFDRIEKDKTGKLISDPLEKIAKI